MSELFLIKECVKQKLPSQKELYCRYANKMMGVCVRYASCYEEAKDFMHEGFIQIFDKIHTYKHEGSLEGWMRKVMVNSCLMELRRKKNIREIEDTDMIDTTMETANFNLNTEDILKFIQGLPQGFRMVFNLYAIEGYSHKEIGEIMNISESTSKSQYSRARNVLKSLIEKERKYESR